MAERMQDFKTGDRVNEAGRYKSKAGQFKDYNQEEVFATCPNTGKETTWTKEE
jgi:hypothetical protein